MVLWCDRLEELLGDLDRSCRLGGCRPFDMPPPIETFQLAVHACLPGTAENRARAEQDPRIQTVWEYYERFGRLRNTVDRRADSITR